MTVVEPRLEDFRPCAQLRCKLYSVAIHSPRDETPPSTACALPKGSPRRSGGEDEETSGRDGRSHRDKTVKSLEVVRRDSER